MNFSEILNQCLNTNDKIRFEAEKAVDRLALENYGLLLLNSARELSNEDGKKEHRQLCATLIKNMILHQPKHAGKWELLKTEIKDEIKANALSSLGSNINEIRKAAAIAVAGIGKLEIPKGQWPDLIGILISTATNENLSYRISSITTIGYIAQELNPGQLSKSEVDQMLSALLRNLDISSLNTDIILPALIAFLNFLIFTQKNIESPNDRNIIFNTIFSCMQSESVEVQVYTMQCLVEIARLYYDFLESHLTDIIAITENQMLHGHEKVSIQAYEVWCSISDVEINRIANNQSIRKYCERALPVMFNVIKFHLLNRNIIYEKSKEDEWTNVKAAITLLDNLSRCTDEYVVNEVFQLISENLGSDKFIIRDSVILAFGSILETRCRSKLKDIIEGAIPTLTSMLSDQSVEVRCTVSWCIKKICELHGDCLVDPNTFDTVINAILNNLSGNRKMVVNLCEAIHHLAYHFKPETSYLPKAGMLSKYTNILLETLLTVAFTKEAYDNNNNIVLASLLAMGSVIEYSHNESNESIEKFFVNIYEAFKSTLNPDNFPTEEIRLAYQRYLATVISSCTAGVKIHMQFDQALAIYSLLKESFDKRANVYEEGLLACSSLSLTLKENFEQILPDFFGYLHYALEQWQDASICIIAINSTSDLLRALGQKMNSYIPSIMSLILTILKNESDKSLKTQALLIITDMFCYTRDEALKHYGDVMDLLEKALVAAEYPVDKNEDADLLEYFQNLREHLLECLTCIMHCLQEINRTDLFNPYIRSVITFAEKIVEEQYEPTLEIFAAVAGIFGDMCEIYRGEMRGTISISKCKYVINKLLNERKYDSLCKWSSQVRRSFNGLADIWHNNDLR